MIPISRFVEKIKTITNKKSLLTSLRQVTYFSGVGLIAQIIMMVYAIIVARALGPNQLGIYSGLYAILGVSITLVNFGLDSWLLKEAHNYELTREITGKIISIKLTIGSLWGILCLVLLPILRPNNFSLVLVFLAICDVLCDVLFNSITTTWNIQRKIKQLNIMLLVSRAGKISLLLGLLFLKTLSPISIIGSRFLISLIVLLISLYLTKPVLKRVKVKSFATILRGSTVFAVSEILAMVYANIDITILTFFSLTDTGLYSPASGIIHALFIIPNSFYIYLIPKYSKLVSGEKRRNISDFFIKIILIFVTVGFTISLLLLVGGKFMVTQILGEKYLITADLIRILSPIMLFKSAAFGLALIIVITNNQKRRLIPQLIVSLFNIIANILLIPKFGLYGVAWIYTISETILMMSYLLIVITIIKNDKNKTKLS